MSILILGLLKIKKISKLEWNFYKYIEKKAMIYSKKVHSKILKIILLFKLKKKGKIELAFKEY